MKLIKKVLVLINILLILFIVSCGHKNGIQMVEELKNKLSTNENVLDLDGGGGLIAFHFLTSNIDLVCESVGNGLELDKGDIESMSSNLITKYTNGEGGVEYQDKYGNEYYIAVIDIDGISVLQALKMIIGANKNK